MALSQKAWKQSETSTLPKYYFNFAKEKKNIAKDTSAYTPAVSLIIGLREVLLIFKETGLKEMRALDLGCGVGRITTALARYFKFADGIER